MSIRVLLTAVAVVFISISCDSQVRAQSAAIGGTEIHYVVAPVNEERYPWSSRRDIAERDLDADGVVKTATVVRAPSDIVSAGGLDEVNFIGPRELSQTNPNVVPASEVRKSAVGTINRIDIVNIRGVDTLLVRINTSINSPGTQVDLGSIESWPRGTLRLRNVLTASGPSVNVGDRTVILADRAVLNTGSEIEIRR